MNQVTVKIDRIYTDGACSGNPGPGGWGTVVYFADGGIQELGGGDRATTNNRMEMQAAIGGLEYYIASGQKEGIILYTDSEYVKNGITKWISGWKKKGWKTSTGKAVLNQDLWEKLDELHSSKVEWRYVKGHSGDEGNERCDVIARSFSRNSPIPLRQYPVDESQKTKPALLISEVPAQLALQTVSELPESLTSTEVNEMALSIVETSSSLSIAQENKSAMQTLRETLERLRFADEAAKSNYLLTTEELATIVQLTPKTIVSHKEDWVWRSWLISRVREEGKQILWQLERIEDL
jgi:ribonuclease HI